MEQELAQLSKHLDDLKIYGEAYSQSLKSYEILVASREHDIKSFYQFNLNCNCPVSLEEMTKRVDHLISIYKRYAEESREELLRFLHEHNLAKEIAELEHALNRKIKGAK